MLLLCAQKIRYYNEPSVCFANPCRYTATSHKKSVMIYNPCQKFINPNKS
jgi:hypothetical protein